MHPATLPTQTTHGMSQRLHQPEWMDEPDLDPALHRQALAGLARLNAVGRSAAILWNALRPQRRAKQRLRVLDLACGGGDVPIQLARYARRQRLPWTFVGIDKSEVALDLAAQSAKAAGVDIAFMPHDVLAGDLPEGFDIVTCSLFLHHLSDDQAAELLAKAGRAAGQRLLVNDLYRSRFNYLATWLGCHVLTRSPVVHVDGPISIKAAFTRREALQLAADAGLVGVTVESRFPARWLLQWSPP